MKGLRTIRQLLPEVDLDTERDRRVAACLLAGWTTGDHAGDVILVCAADARYANAMRASVGLNLFAVPSIPYP